MENKFLMYMYWYMICVILVFKTPNVPTPPRVPTPVGRVSTPVERVATPDVTDSRRDSVSSESTQSSVDYALRIQDPRGRSRI